MFTSIALARLTTKIQNFPLNLHFREDGVVGIATRYGLDDVGVELRAAIDCLFSIPRDGRGPTEPSQLVQELLPGCNGTGEWR